MNNLICKRLLSLLLCTVMLLSYFVGITPIKTEAAQTVPDGLVYEIVDGCVTITDYTGSAVVLDIPDTIEGYPVTIIGSSAFDGCLSLKSITLPDGITTIGIYAFMTCSNLICVTIPDSVTNINYSAFAHCDMLKHVAFTGTQSQWSSIDISNYNEDLTQGILHYETRLELISNCAKFSVYCPVCEENLFLEKKEGGVHSFTDGICTTCGTLEPVPVPEGLTYEIVDGAVTITDYTGNAPVLVIPDTIEGFTVKTIGKDAFYNCDSLLSVTIPSTVVTITEGAFNNCSNIEHITLPFNRSGLYCQFFGYLFGNTYFGDAISIWQKSYGAATIGYKSWIPKSLNSVTINGGELKEGAFNNCSVFNCVTISENVTLIEDGVFAGCSNLTHVAYTGTESQWNALSIGDGNTKLTEAIRHYETSLDFHYNCIEYGVYCPVCEQDIYNTKIDNGSHAFGQWVLIQEPTLYEYGLQERICTNCGFKEEESVPKIAGLTYMVMVDHVVITQYNGALTDVVIPAEIEGLPVTEIGDSAFMGSNALTSITLPDTIVRIGDSAFMNCTNLTGIQIPEAVTYIGDSAFMNCSAIKTVTVPDSVTTIGASAFFYCSKLTEAKFGKGVTIVPDSLFFNCTKLVNVEFANAVASYGVESFWNCSSLKQIKTADDFITEIPEGDYIIGSNAFWNCARLTSFQIPDCVTEIGAEAFWNCMRLKEIIIPEGVITIGDSAFWSCTLLQEIKIPDSVTQLGIEVFSGCSMLNKLEIGSGITEIPESTFNQCGDLTNVVLPETVTVIGDSAFAGCVGMVSVIVPQSVSQMEVSSFELSTVLLVYENSYAHNFAVLNNLTYCLIHNLENPEIAYGTSIFGTVSNAKGALCEGVTVELLYSDGTVKQTLKTDSNGVYRFAFAEVGDYTIFATDASGKTASSAVSVVRMNEQDVFLMGNTNLKLKSTWSVSGTVNCETGTVTITGENDNVLGTVEVTDGSFCFDNISNGTYILTVTTENGSVSQEITVFDGNVQDITLQVAPSSATLWGYVEVEDRLLERYRKHWADVVVYDAAGLTVAQCKTDIDGKYSFSGLPIGQYSIVVEATEMRPDYEYGFERSYTLSGCVDITITDVGTHQAETIILREVNDCQATISGKVTAQGETQDCRVILQDVFRNEIASMTTGKNGKFTFKNIPDGMYIITAITKSDGAGVVTITVQNGIVHSEIEIHVKKSDKIKNREALFSAEVPHCDGKDEAMQYRERIAEEKHFYDGLSEKEKSELSQEYVSRLDKLVCWVTDCTIHTDDGVVLEQSGLVISGEEVKNAEDITFTLNVTPSEAHDASTDGVNSREDQIHHNIHDKANKHDVLQYYDITLSKEVDGVSTQITSVTKDTEANGKLRVTMEIPEEYRGYKHYTIIHEHCGDVVTLTDLDDDPNTVTFEVKKFSTFVLAGTNIALTEIEDEDSSIVESWGLTLTDSIVVNFTMAESALTDENAYVEVTTAETVTNIPAEEAKQGIQVTLAAAQMNEIISLCVIDGSGNRSESSTYTVRQYCDTILADEDFSQHHALVKEMLNYGAMAQICFDCDAENLANDGITDVATTDVPETTADMAVSDKISGLRFYGASLVYRDRIAVRYYFTGDVNGCAFTANGNTYTPTPKDGMYYIEIADILPQDLDQQITLTVTDLSGNTLTVTYGPMNYIVRMNEKGSDTLKALVKALYNYHLAAKALTA